jgi:hypothetical protein
MDYALCPPLRVPEGAAIAGGSMETYLAGTSTPLATYADPAGTANPTTVPLNTSGRPDGAVYLATTDLSGNPVAYKFIVRDAAGQTVYTQDDVRAGGLQLFDLGNVVNLGDFPTLQDAIDAIGSDQRTLVVSEAVAVAANTTVPANVSLLFLGEGMLAPGAGVTLTINGPMNAPDAQVFGTDGAVVFGVGRRREVDPRWWGAAPGGDATLNTTAFQAAFDAISALPADTTANPKADTGGQVVVSPGQYDIDGEVASDSDAVELIGSGIATRINLQGAGRFRFGTYDPVTGKGGAGSRNPKHVRVRDIHIVAAAGHNAGRLIEIPMSHNLVVERVRITSSETTNAISGLYLQAFQYVNVKDCIFLTNAYPLHLYLLASAPQYEAHVRITGTELFLNGNVQQGACAALHIEAETGRTNPVWDFTMERCLLAAFTQDPNEQHTIGLKITNPNGNAVLSSAVLHGVMFEQCETLVDAATYTTDDASHLLFDGCPFLGKAGVTQAAWRGNDTKSRPVFRGCTFTNMQDMIVQSDPILGEGNNATGITGNLFSSTTSVRYNGLERPFINQPRFRFGGSAAVGNNDPIAHGLIATPTRVVVAPQNSLYSVSVASKDTTNVTVGVRDVTTGALVGTPVTVYWEAAV